MDRVNGFVKLNVHGLVYHDDYCEFASAIRDELLAYPDWREMRQNSRDSANVLSPQRQNGITTGHLTPQRLDRLPNCARFCQLLSSQMPELCALEGVEFGGGRRLTLETNAMAYGEGAWLSGHTDSTHDKSDRLMAWMLYLTHPDDGEWVREQGGAVRLWVPDGDEVRVSPKFNRFAMFQVHKESYHEIERVTWPTGWEHSRMALSGWIRGVREPMAQGMTVYHRSSNHKELAAAVETRLQGTLALYQLMLKQRQYCGADITATLESLSDYEKDRQAHAAAPPGTSFLHRAPGPSGCITIVDEQGNVCYLGTLDGYRSRAAVPSAL